MTASTQRPALSPTVFYAYLITLPIYGLMRLTDQTQALSVMTVIIITLLFSASMLHLFETRGWRRAALMASSAFIISLGAEMFGVSTGLLFGNYIYSEQLGPRVLGLVPLIIPVAWLMMLYPSYSIANYLIQSLTHNPSLNRMKKWMTTVLTTIVAAFAMTAWDLSLDPRMVQDGNWTWHGGGAYFGIPISNFIGWFITAFVIYVLWQAIDKDQFHIPLSLGESARVSSSLPVYAYIIQWIGESMANVVFWGNPMVGAAVFISMGIFSVAALLQLAPRRKNRAQST